MGIRRLVAVIISKFGLIKLVRNIANINPTLKVLAYHRVMDVDKENYPYDIELVSASIEQFDQQVKYLSKNYHIDTLTNVAENFLKFKTKNMVALTFDDGFDDLYHIIFPILKKHNTTATFFITTGLIGKNEVPWFDKVVYAIKKSHGKKLILQPHLNDMLIDEDSVEEVISKVMTTLKTVDNDERLSLINSIELQLGSPCEEDIKLSKMLDWNMVKEMSDYGIEFGSHTVSHPVLSRLNKDQLHDELIQSKNEIEEHTGKECKIIGYPVGGENAFNDSVLKLSQKLNYKFGCSYISGENFTSNFNKFEIKRLHVESCTDFHWFKGQLAIPMVCAADYSR